MHGLIVKSLLAIFLLSGCTTLLQTIAEKPETSLKDVKVTKIGLSALDLDIVLDIHNPNRFQLALLELNYEIVALDMLIGEGRFGEGFHIPAGESRELTIPLSVQPRAALNLARHLLNSQSDVLAELKGGLRFDTPLGPFRVALKEEKIISNPLSR